jgi:hypothetical protein
VAPVDCLSLREVYSGHPQFQCVDVLCEINSSGIAAVGRDGSHSTIHATAGEHNPCIAAVRDWTHAWLIVVSGVFRVRGIFRSVLVQLIDGGDVSAGK